MQKNIFTHPSIESEAIEELTRKLLETTELLKSSNQELIKAREEKSEMLANLSHDLRAPLTAIRNTVEYLLSQDCPDREDLRTSLALIDRRSRTLESLFRDMDYLFRIEDSSGSFRFESMQAAPFFEEYYYETLSNDYYNAYHIHLDMDESLDCVISVDSQKIIRVLDNLFTNAAKYSPPGADITLRVTCQRDYLLVSVTDTGIGIPQDAIGKIFNRTYTVASARTPSSGNGSGFGLAIVKAIVERHRGAVSCRSAQGEGSTFSFTLPLLVYGVDGEG